jgi:hypothetical protein
VTTINYFIPYYVNEQQSDIRGVKRGWYAMDERGKLGSGPFATPCECLGSGSQIRTAPFSMWLH